jgi:urease accessory protein
MKEVTREYLGNINHDLELARLITSKTCLKVDLQFVDRSKGRIYAHTNSGIEIGIIKSRDRTLQSGDLFRTNSGKLLLINLHEQEVLILDFSALDPHISGAELVHLGHVLGNQHYPIKIHDKRVFVQLVTDKITLENILKDLNISGLKMDYQHLQYDSQFTFSSHNHE